MSQKRIKCFLIQPVQKHINTKISPQVTQRNGSHVLACGRRYVAVWFLGLWLSCGTRWTLCWICFPLLSPQCFKHLHSMLWNFYSIRSECIVLLPSLNTYTCWRANDGCFYDSQRVVVMFSTCTLSIKILCRKWLNRTVLNKKSWW